MRVEIQNLKISSYKNHIFVFFSKIQTQKIISQIYFLIVKHSFSGFLEKVDIENTQTYYLTPPELGDTVF